MGVKTGPYRSRTFSCLQVAIEVILFNGEVQDLRLSGRPNGTHWLDVKEGTLWTLDGQIHLSHCEASLSSFATFASVSKIFQNHSFPKKNFQGSSKTGKLLLP
ncbi:hypothetical protein NPIL_463651 [Nephila pilipes]|uniref:Uncharacterized protein n=1 Tax=Nephila pilipes TaxID=299642 RepID=A0A8X6UKL2_NEPPI|nr:hypothetical protein NPIL_463651 [Nephila pilipes]